jgi:hypothetical protein
MFSRGISLQGGMGFISPSIRLESQVEAIGICPSPAITGSGKSIIQILFSISHHRHAAVNEQRTHLAKH